MIRGGQSSWCHAGQVDRQNVRGCLMSGADCQELSYHACIAQCHVHGMYHARSWCCTANQRISLASQMHNSATHTLTCSSPSTCHSWLLLKYHSTVQGRYLSLWCRCSTGVYCAMTCLSFSSDHGIVVMVPTYAVHWLESILTPVVVK